LYSVEQLPRCDLLRLSPRLGDSSCRIDETPAPALPPTKATRRARTQDRAAGVARTAVGESNTPRPDSGARGRCRSLARAHGSRRKQHAAPGLGGARPVSLARTRTRQSAKATRRTRTRERAAGVASLLACSHARTTVGESNMPRPDSGSRGRCRTHGNRRKQHAAPGLESARPVSVARPHARQ